MWTWMGAQTIIGRLPGCLPRRRPWPLLRHGRLLRQLELPEAMLPWTAACTAADGYLEGCLQGFLDWDGCLDGDV